MAFGRNVVFTLCTALVLLSCIVNAGIFADGGQDVRKSYLEGREYQLRPDFSIERFASRAYQDEFEQYAADAVPMRDLVLLENAWLQRQTIIVANAVFGFDVYPTFFGSEYLACPTYETIAEYPSSQRTVTDDVLGKPLRAVWNMVGSHPGIQWRFALVERSRNALSNPAHDLVSMHADYNYYRTKFLEKLPTACPYVDISVGDKKHYLQGYFHTDHHTQISGAIDAYKKICTTFGRKPLADLEIARIYDGPFYGSEARNGLIVDYFDTLEDVVKSPVEFIVEVDGRQEPLSWLNRGYGQGGDPYAPTERFANAYAEWFHKDAGEIHISNSKGKGSLLIVGDSFTNNMDYLFAYSYRDVYILDPRHYEGILEDFLKRHEVDDALFLMASNTLVGSSTRAFLASR